MTTLGAKNTSSTLIKAPPPYFQHLLSAQEGIGFLGADSSSVESSLFWSIP